MAVRSTAYWDFMLCIPLEELPIFFWRTYFFQSFNPEDGGNRFLQKVGKFVPDCIASHPRLE
jgi:hypothetical protein